MDATSPTVRAPKGTRLGLMRHSTSHHPPAQVEQCIMGNVVGAGLGQAPARQAALAGGLHPNTVCTTVNKVCSSGIKAITMAAQAIAMGDATCVVAGGMESMSNMSVVLPLPSPLGPSVWGSCGGRVCAQRPSPLIFPPQPLLPPQGRAGGDADGAPDPAGRNAFRRPLVPLWRHPHGQHRRGVRAGDGDLEGGPGRPRVRELHARGAGPGRGRPLAGDRAGARGEPGGEQLGRARRGTQVCGLGSPRGPPPRLRKGRHGHGGQLLDHRRRRGGPGADDGGDGAEPWNSRPREGRVVCRRGASSGALPHHPRPRSPGGARPQRAGAEPGRRLGAERGLQRRGPRQPPPPLRGWGQGEHQRGGCGAGPPDWSFWDPAGRLAQHGTSSTSIQLKGARWSRFDMQRRGRRVCNSARECQLRGKRRDGGG
mmetsp:Transcript_49860/g.159403  ORF Transcript_49860/g.159403 Transcript_49860/m.159403 type:complete len:426 (+) Transcript_49860:387-1664(+)